ncbi:hypothetical protein SEA_ONEIAGILLIAN_79 [Microbacterium phage OneinaGillian]|uniref:Uncharacterized protein n=1 Tax=Microbacterium phage OneinaGillian TaxID=2301604 RepID=A0A385UJE7_9CAUD|nr:hypothetical protein HOU23_gp079 [Microbacterium phage OneinaGillian]AYB70189.1 hypothetical protein SEA_ONEIAGILLIAN_79 [Microbacterium phage OneinaGillian]QKO02832.1 hypothetical protein SEA_KELCOLE_80 [Microbacterium phage Kelcole]
MRLRALTYGERETVDGELIPETVTVEMSIEEVLALTEIAGRVLGPSQAQTSSPIYQSLTSLVNQTWENGIDEAVRQLQIEPWKFKPGTRDYG